MFGRRPLLLVAALPVGALVAACGSQPGDAPAASAAEVVAEVGPPASQYAPSLADVGPGYSVDQPNTYTLTEDSYSAARTFTSPAKGKELLHGWGYLGGYETSYVPQGQETAIASGGYYVTVECHLFATDAGAQQAYAYFESRLRSATGTERLPVTQMGDAASAWLTAQGKARPGSVEAAYHRVLFRRKNMVVVVQTYGAARKMTLEHAEAIAGAIEARMEASGTAAH